MAREDNPEMQLVDSVETIAEILCSRCLYKGRVSGIMDSGDALEIFYSNGWRATEKHTYCKKCAKKYLKKQKL